MKSAYATLFRRTLANILDTTIEILGGLLGSYFGMMLAALLETVNDGPAEQMQNSMWSGFGFGLIFWTLSLSFLNRVLIQGLSRASVGKKIFKLELISTDGALTWNTIVGRWLMGFGSFALCGLGYFSAFFNKEGRTFHDLAAHTDVVPIYVGSSMSVEYREHPPVAMMVFNQSTAERPMATVIRMPLVAVASSSLSATPQIEGPPIAATPLAQVIELDSARTARDLTARAKAAQEDDSSDSGAA